MRSVNTGLELFNQISRQIENALGHGSECKESITALFLDLQRTLNNIPEHDLPNYDQRIETLIRRVSSSNVNLGHTVRKTIHAATLNWPSNQSTRQERIAHLEALLHIFEVNPISPVFRGFLENTDRDDISRLNDLFFCLHTTREFEQGDSVTICNALLNNFAANALFLKK